MKRLMIVLTLMGLLVAACGSPEVGDISSPTEAPISTTGSTGSGTETPSSTRPAPTGTPKPSAGGAATPSVEPPTPTRLPVDVPAPQRAALEALAAALGISPAEIKLVKIEAVDWPDGCLGIVRPGVMCTTVITPGFRVVLEAKGQQYEYHTNRDGSVVLSAGIPATVKAEPAAATALALALGMPASRVKVASATPVEWPDSCLGIALPGMVCAQMITPGYLMVLEADGRRYEYHTNQDGSVVLPGTIALTWHREGGIAGFCDDLTVFLSGEVYASWCKPNARVSQASLPMILSQDEQTRFNGWLASFGTVNITQKDPAVADAMTIALSVTGSGARQPTDAERQALLELAQTIFTRVQP